jgi:hypothetical protein
MWWLQYVWILSLIGKFYVKEFEHYCTNRTIRTHRLLIDKGHHDRSQPLPVTNGCIRASRTVNRFSGLRFRHLSNRSTNACNKRISSSGIFGVFDRRRVLKSLVALVMSIGLITSCNHRRSIGKCNRQQTNSQINALPCYWFCPSHDTGSWDHDQNAGLQTVPSEASCLKISPSAPSSISTSDCCFDQETKSCLYIAHTRCIPLTTCQEQNHMEAQELIKKEISNKIKPMTYYQPSCVRTLTDFWSTVKPAYEVWCNVIFRCIRCRTQVTHFQGVLGLAHLFVSRLKC